MPPLGLAYIAGSLIEAGHEVKIIDAQVSGYLKDDIRRELMNYSPDIAGITTMTSNFKGALEAAEIAKSLGITTVAGGPNLEVFPEETLSHKYIDFGILGEGEQAFVELLDAIEHNNPFSGITGLAYKEGGSIKVNGTARVDNIDKLPVPARHLLPIDMYSSVISIDPMTTMITSRGCPFHCAFCFKQFADKKIRYRDPVKVVDEMELLINEYGIKEIMLYDDNIATKVSHIEGICREILKRNLKVRWESPCRVNRITLPLLKLMREAGCVRLRYGVESGDQKILESMNKKISIEMIEKAFEMTRSVGIETFAYFITGYLNETREAFENTLSLIKKIKPDKMMMTVTIPYPKTELERQSVEAGKMPLNYWKNFVLGKVNVPLAPLVKESNKWVREAYFKFYLNPLYILKRLIHINSLDQFKKHILAGIGVIFFRVK